ncbi:MAG TPA: glucokinase, partial [Polyangium sp.]|nr:glucokinase [Polyangium sp.]
IVSAKREAFLEGFCAKGRFSKMLSQIPVVLVTDPLIGVRGAVAMAKELLVDRPKKPVASGPTAQRRPKKTKR